MAVIMFQHRFAPLVESGQKRQTIRPKRKRPIKAGDKLSLRQWTDKPYRSKQRVLRDAEAKSISGVELYLGPIGNCCIKVDGGILAPGAMYQFAVSDGFSGSDEMFGWFNNTHGLPFEGELIKW